MVIIKKYPEQKVELFNYGESLGFVNKNEFMDARIQIATNKFTGYHIIFNNKIIIIDSGGRVRNHPDGLFDTSNKLLSDLWEARAKI